MSSSTRLLEIVEDVRDFSNMVEKTIEILGKGVVWACQGFA